jgi:hypothetical protein
MTVEYTIIWDLDDDPRGNVQHILEHGITVADYEHALTHAIEFYCKSTYPGQEIAVGPDLAGRMIDAAYEVIDATTIYPTTAYYVEE